MIISENEQHNVLLVKRLVTGVYFEPLALVHSLNIIY